MKDQLSFNQKYYKMIKGYWNGQVFEIRNEEKWNNHLENNSVNFIPIFAGQPKEKIQGSNIMFAALVEFNSL